MIGVIKHELAHLYAAAIACRMKGIPLAAFTVEFDPTTTDMLLLPAQSVTKAAAQSIVALAAYGPIAAVVIHRSSRPPRNGQSG